MGLANGDKHIPVSVGAARPDGVCLARTPVRVQAQEDVVTKDVPNRYEDWLPCPKRKLDERVEITALEAPKLDQLIPHYRRRYLRRRRQASAARVFRNVPRRIPGTATPWRLCEDRES